MSSQAVKFGAWAVILLNLLMAFGSIWIFMRMAPAIEVIIARNVLSLEASEEMLAILGLAGEGAADASARQAFQAALERAEKNITEQEETELLARITKFHQPALAGERAAKRKTVEAIAELGRSNRSAMHRADLRAQELGLGGAWAVVFMASAAFLVNMLFLRGLKKNLLLPLEEINLAVTAFSRGDSMRRCSYKGASKPMQALLLHINELMDGHRFNALNAYNAYYGDENRPAAPPGPAAGSVEEPERQTRIQS